MSTSHTIPRVLLGCCLVVALLLLQTTASAENLMIQYTGLDISYDGSTITQVGNPDPLTSIIFTVDDTLLLGLLKPEDSPLAIVFSVPGVTNIPVGGGTVTSVAGGTLDLTFPDGKFLNLELGQAEVTYYTAGVLNLFFALGAGSAGVVDQSLPIDGEIEGNVAISFSAQIKPSSLDDDGTWITAFTASGSGEVDGSLVPEPATVGLLISGLLACLAFLRRRG